ncbi:hypothetical protein N7520_004111 [Penicillium odoratum]|uniref:uncharacterized protein n=1 Tax=Penicillium odoratum TaxID=1167516 RepID=UPI002549285F|nr:uncharacterized protein N7520_004111 [Penicillium odoratum]KAJ5769552.1 hypothetical protein N7520_004111 [Penicillium odoratum]
MADSSAKEIDDIVEEVELYQFILDDQKATTPDDHVAISETLETINKLQARLASLLGTVAPTSPPHSSPPEPQIEDLSRATPQTPTRAKQLLPVPGQYWPSSAPSPFSFQSNSHAGPSLPPISSLNSGESSRKRPREGSIGSLGPSQSSKRAIVSKSQNRMQEIEAKLLEELETSRREFAKKREREEVRKAARWEGISEEQVLHELNEEECENEKLIRDMNQIEKDGEFARMLQAGGDDYEEDQPHPQPHPSYNIPDRTLPHPTSLLSPSLKYENEYRSPRPEILDSDDDLQEITPESFLSARGHTLQQPSSYLPRQSSAYPTSFTSPQAKPVMPGMPSMGGMHPAIAARYAMPNGKYLPYGYSPASAMSTGQSPMYMGQPPMYMGLPSLSSPRRLPWISSQHPEMSAFDLVREQQDMEEDTIDFELYKEEDFPDDIKNLLTGIKDINKATRADDDETPRELQVTLMKHQKVGLAWMKAKEESNHKGGILADDMGLGKTIQTIALMVARPPTDPDRHPTLIVAPKALMEQWRLEIGRHVKPGRHQLSVFVFHGLTRQVPWRELRKYDVIITTFGTLTANHKIILRAEKLQEENKDASIVRQVRDGAVLYSSASKWHRVILDEAQNIKNPLAKSTKACCKLDATYRWCLTGTPMMNRLEDFQSLLGFLKIRPYNNKEKFKRTFVKPIKNGWGEDNVMKQLRVLVKSVCLRRTKKTKIDGQPILQLPPKVIEKIHVVFNEEEKGMYDELSSNSQNQIRRYLNAGTLGKNYSHVLVLLLRLRQACDHPLLINGFNNANSTVVQGVDLVANAKLLDTQTVERIKNNEDDDDGTCPICMDSVENAVIYIPCGHSLCSECFARISDPAQLAHQDTAGMIKCQNCRGQVDPCKVTDAISFKKAHHDGESEPVVEESEQSEVSDSDEYDSDTETDGSGKKRKKRSLAELRAAAQKNKAEKAKYLRRLEKSYTPSAKITKAMEILQANEDRGSNEKTIIFSQFTSLLDLLEIPILQKGWLHVRFDGSMNIADRNKSVAAFTDMPECKIMLVSLKAGNAGLNLVAASHVILFDPFWNPYVEDQAIDRAHRIGQTRDVFVHRLLIEDTVEDRIIELQEKKRELIEGALDEGGSMNVSRLDTRELAYLFGVSA